MIDIGKYTATAVLVCVTPIALACDYPERAKIVNGLTASKDEMVESQRSVQAYMVAMETYLQCIDAAEKEAVATMADADEETLEQRQVVLAKKHNAAVEEMEIVAAQFNEQVRLYKGRDE